MDENPDLIVKGSFRGRKITAHREYHSKPPRPSDCVADWDDYDLGDRRGWGETPEAALDDLLEQAQEKYDEYVDKVVEAAVKEIRSKYEGCVEQLYGLTLSLENSVEEFFRNWKDDDLDAGTLALEWIAAAGEPENAE